MRTILKTDTVQVHTFMGSMITDILGYIGAFLMGISLGVIGGGGLIFSVPILVYILE